MFRFIGEKGTLIMFICNHCPYVKAVIKLVNTTLELKHYGIVLQLCQMIQKNILKILEKYEKG